MSCAHWDKAALLDVVGERGPLSLFLVTSYGSVYLRSVLTLGTTVRFSEPDTLILGFSALRSGPACPLLRSTSQGG